ncbi:LysR substrate-binding domain-containing protein [Methylonatrum kenyense]|uniref:LysR substrate-binding domain-containing protein n=1 Tax=Methylonatrum kenyense TaxID=455253 RepID=UPI0020BD6A67|nr:LysR substrate-binding domain-containing protein [Methylonatrum kenyense]MCK8515838.1 LysR substrate-binding domain-containing protein [Methylonatrum kenyense]
MVDILETLGGSLDDVRAFCAVTEFGTVSAAARQLGETKGSVSRRLSRLERRLGVQLLARTPRAVTPTDEGLAFHARAREALNWLDEAAEAARQSKTVPRGHLRITAPMDFGMTALPDLLVQFRARHPQITMELVLANAPIDLAAHRVDLALRAAVDDLPDMGYRASTVGEFRIGLYASPSYLAAAGGAPVTPADLKAHDLVVAREFSGTVQLTLTGDRRKRREVAVRPVVQANDYASILRIAAAGGGIAPVPDLVAAGSIATGAVRRVLPEWHAAEGTLYAITLGGRDAPARVRVFREFVRENLRASHPL